MDEGAGGRLPHAATRHGSRGLRRHALIPATLGLALAVTIAARATAAELPAPALDGFDPSVRTQLAETREETERLLTSESAPAEGRATALGELARLYLAYDLGDAARDAVDRALALDPGSAALHHLSGWMAESAGDLERAERDLARALELDPTRTAVRVYLGRTRLARDDLDGARAVLEPAAQRSLAARFELARVASRSGDWAGAVGELEALLAAAPDATQAYAPLAIALARLGRPQQARAALERRGEGRVPLADPLVDGIPALATGASVQRFRGDQLVIQERFREAAAAYAEAAGNAPDDFFIARSLGLTLYRVGRVDEALAALERAAALDPGGDEAQNAREIAAVELSIAGIHLNARRDREALPHLVRATTLDPALGDAALQLGLVHGRAGRGAEALDAFALALAADPDHRQALLHHATTLMDLGRFDEAVPELERLIALEPTHPRAAQLLAIARSRARR